jgi:hypothetical protein
MPGFAVDRTMPRLLASCAIASLACIAATGAPARELAQPPCVVDAGCANVPVAPRPPEAVPGRLPGYADPAERDATAGPIAATDALATERRTVARAPSAPHAASIAR